MRKFWWMVLAAAMVAGCGDEQETDGVDSYVIEADDYDRSCQVDADCVTIFEGDYCKCAACVNAAIAKTALEQFEGDREGAEACRDSRTRCGSLTEHRTVEQATSCPPARAVCEAGTCELREDR